MSAIYDLLEGFYFPDEIKHSQNGEETSEIIIKFQSKIDAMKFGNHPPSPYLNLQADEVFRVRILQESVRQDRARMYRLQQHAPHEYGFKS